MRRAFIYARVSTKKDEQINALEASILRSRSLCATRGFDVVRVFSDTMTGSKTSRPDYQRMLAAVEKKEADVVVVPRLDRLTRSVAEAIRVVNDFKAKGVDLVVVDNQHLDTTTPMGKFVFHLFAALGELERDFIRERVQRGLETARARGRILGRPLKEVTLALRAIEMRKAGATLGEIEKALKADGHDVSRSWVARRCVGIPVPVREASGLSIPPDSDTPPPVGPGGPEGAPPEGRAMAPTRRDKT